MSAAEGQRKARRTGELAVNLNALEAAQLLLKRARRIKYHDGVLIFELELAEYA
jgi:hypothetical protein